MSRASLLPSLFSRPAIASNVAVAWRESCPLHARSLATNTWNLHISSIDKVDEGCQPAFLYRDADRYLSGDAAFLLPPFKRSHDALVSRYGYLRYAVSTPTASLSHIREDGPLSIADLIASGTQWSAAWSIR